jgi:hypothetical protein
MFWRFFSLRKSEIGVGFILATIFWIGVLGWQAAYAPTEIEKRQCEETAAKSGHKTEECKTLWERTTSDPVAFFTFWRVVFTGGLTVSIVLLWRAGERQIELVREGSAAQSRDMQASIGASQRTADAAMLTVGAERAWMIYEDLPIIGIKDSPINGRDIGLSAKPVWKNMGRSPALMTNIAVSAAVIDIRQPSPPSFTAIGRALRQNRRSALISRCPAHPILWWSRSGRLFFKEGRLGSSTARSDTKTCSIPASSAFRKFVSGLRAMVTSIPLTEQPPTWKSWPSARKIQPAKMTSAAQTARPLT